MNGGDMDMKLLIFLFIIGFTAYCSQVEEEPVIAPNVVDTGEIRVAEKVEIDFNVENNKIAFLHGELVSDVNHFGHDRDPVLVTSYWIQSGSVLMAHNFFGQLITSRTRRQIRGSWTSIFAQPAQWPMISKIEEIWIEKKRGQLARSEGTFAYQGQAVRPFKALYQKNKKGEWKIKAMDYGDNGYIKGYKIVL
jgi:hypothetical protein